jgi:predicted RNA-binding protein with PIN domain
VFREDERELTFPPEHWNLNTFAMRYRRVIIDGYSLMHRMPDLAPRAGSSLAAARQQLVQHVERLAPFFGDATTVVFDGQQSGGASPMESTVIEVIFSPANQTADTVIERLVHSDPNPAQILVVASDRSELDTISAAGADGMSCDHYLEHCRIHEREFQRTARPYKTPKRGPSLGDFFP